LEIINAVAVNQIDNKHYHKLKKKVMDTRFIAQI